MSLVLRVGVESDEAMRSIMGGLPSARLRSCPRLPDQLDRWLRTRWRAATDGHPARPAPTSLGRRPARHGWGPGRPHADVYAGPHGALCPLIARVIRWKGLDSPCTPWRPGYRRSTYRARSTPRRSADVEPGQDLR